MTRSRLRTSVLLASAALAICGIFAPAGAETLTVKQMEALSDKAAGDKAKQDLLSMLEPTGQVFDLNEAGSQRIRMHSKPIGSDWSGLCVRDELFVDYAAPGSKGLDERLSRLDGFAGRRTYRVIEAPIAELRRASVEGRLRWTARCGELSLDASARWFPADNPIEAAKAANAVDAAAKAIRSGRLQPKDCSVQLSGETCAQAVLDSGRSLQIESVSTSCTPGPGQECYVVDVVLTSNDTVRLTIVASFEKDSPVVKEIAYISADGPLFYRTRSPPG